MNKRQSKKQNKKRTLVIIDNIILEDMAEYTYNKIYPEWYMMRLDNKFKIIKNKLALRVKHDLKNIFNGFRKRLIKKYKEEINKYYNQINKMFSLGKIPLENNIEGLSEDINEIS